MTKALRFPSRWAGRPCTLAITAALSAALGACESFDNVFYGAREGTIEYPGSGNAGNPKAAASYVVKYKDTVDGVAERYGVSSQAIIDANNLKPPYALTPGRTIAIPGARVVTPAPAGTTATATATPPPGPVQHESLPPPPQGEAPRSAAPAAATAAEPTPLHPPATAASAAPPPAPPPAAPPPSAPPPRFEWPVQGKVVAPYGPRADGQKNDGIEISAEKDATVKAADSGTVVYAGSEVR